MSTDLPETAPTLTAEGLLLRAWTLDDADAVLVLADDAAMRRWSGSMRGLHDRADAVDWIRSRLARRTDWAVVEATTSVLAGRVGLHHHDADDRTCEIGYGVSPAFRRRGLVGRAVEAAVAYAFAPAPDGLGRNRVNLEHAVGNVASCRVAWSLGFAFEGVGREAFARGDGGFDDVHRHARLVSDPAGPLPRVVPAEPVEIAAGPYQLCVPDPDLDAAAVAAAHTDPLIALWNPGPPDLDGARAWCARRADWSEGTHASWVVKAATGGEVLGSMSLHDADGENGSARIGYWVAPAARGRGIGTAALSAAARFAFDAVGLHRVELSHALENEASCRLAQSAGFRLEGVHRDSFRYGDGVLRTEHTHARLATDPEPGLADGGGQA